MGTGGSVTAVFKEKGADESARPLVNYIWIHEKPAHKSLPRALSLFPLQAIERAIQNANRYKGADFKIWVDKKLSDDSSMFWLGSFVAAHAEHNNIKIENLQDIPAYATDQLFRLPKKWISCESRISRKSVYIRADYARIIVLAHCLKQWPKRNYVLYADMDGLDLKLDETTKIMDRYGVAIHSQPHELVSHSYIGLHARTRRVRAQFQTLVEHSQKAAHADNLGYLAFGAFLDRLGFTSKRSVIGRNIMPEPQTEIDVIPWTRDFGVN